MLLSLIGTTASGLLLALSFPKAGIDALAWVAFIPLFWAFERVSERVTATLLGWACGLAFFCVDLIWIYGTLVNEGHFFIVPAAIAFFALAAYLALFFGGFGYLLSLFAARGFKPSVTAPFAWVACEYVRAWLLTGFPWDLLGYSQAGNLYVVQIADVTGIYGLSFLVMWVNATTWAVLSSLARRGPFPVMRVLLTAVLLVGVLAYGELRLRSFGTILPYASSSIVGVLQGNIPQAQKWSESQRERTFRAYEELARKAVNRGAELLVWPETSVPVLIGGPDAGQERPRRISEGLGVPMLIGAPATEPDDNGQRYYNSALLVDGPHVRFRYDKIHLVPFGEFTPLNWLVQWDPGVARTQYSNFSAGSSMTVMNCKDLPLFSVLICYEAIFPELARQAINNGAQFLVNITNDGWFGDSAAPYQHLRMASVRAVENRIWLIRAANTGVSAVVDPAGRITASINLNLPGFLVTRIPGGAPVGSIYSICGDWLAHGCIVVCLALLCGAGKCRFAEKWK